MKVRSIYSMPIYTKIGDKGKTKTFKGCCVNKYDPEPCVCGKVDEVQAAINFVLAELKNTDTKEELEEIQKDLWQLAGEVSGMPAKIDFDKRTAELEISINAFGEPPKGFVQFRDTLSCWLNECRVRTRDLEREMNKYAETLHIRPEVLKYTNRLSDYFFMAGYALGKSRNIQ